MLCHQMLSLAMGSDFHSLSPPATTASHFVHYSLVYLLYAKEGHFCSFVTKSNNPIQHAPNIHPHVFNSSHRIILHGESPLDFHKHHSLKLRFPTFHYRTSSSCYLTMFSSLELSKPLKREFIPSPPRKRSWIAGNSDLLSIRPLMHVQAGSLKTLYP